VSTTIEAIYPLTPMQQGMLFHATSDPDSALYFHQLLATIDDTDPETVKAAFAAVIARQPSLRSLIAWQDRDRPLRLVRPTVEPDWHIEDLSEHPDPTGRIESYLQADRARPFDLQTAPLLRFAMFDLGTGAYRLVWSFHHLVLDGWSTRLVLTEVVEQLRAAREGRRPNLDRPPEYERYLEWLEQRTPPDEAQFWRDHLGDLSDIASVTGGGTPWATRHHRREREVDGRRLADGTTRLGVTVSTVLQAAWALVTRSRFGARHPVIGVTHSGRPHEVDHIERLVGMLINTIPRRIEIDDELQVSEWLSGLQRSGIEWAHHHPSSLSDIRSWVGWERHQSLFDSVIVVENIPDEADSDFRDIEYLERSNVPFALLAVPGDTFRLIGIADADRFEPEVVDHILEEVAHVAFQLVSEPEATIGAISIVGPDERARLDRLESTVAPHLIHQTAATMLSHGIGDRPERRAVVAEDRTIDFATLRFEADRLQSELLRLGASSDGPVAIDARRSSATITAIAACAMAGIPYIPLDPAAAPARRAHILESATVHIDGAGRLRALRSAPPEAPVTPTGSTPVYFMYTSGSTGVPKGVEITQHALATSTQVRRFVYEDPVGAFLVASPLHFDSSVAGLFWTLADGGTVVLPNDDQLDPIDLRRLIAEHSVSHLLTLPSVYRVMLDSGPLPSLATVIVAGEPCPPSLVSQHFEAQPDTDLYNEYGPTEATVWATVHKIEPGDAHRPTVPIGSPIPGTRVIVGDVILGRAPMGAVGEIFISGPQLAQGYRSDSDRTEVAFVKPDWHHERVYRTGDLGRWTADGVLEFRGRRDQQVKLRGHRIELEEIDGLLRQHPSIEDAVTVLRNNRLISFVVGSIPPDLDAHLRDALPVVMIPSVIDVLPELPRGSTGKVDRDALPEVRLATDVVERPLNDVEQIIADAWSEVLGIDVANPEADFFALGGDSLAVMKIVARTRKRGIELTARQFFETGTLAELAAVAQVS
jgi:amino acid adenylation domain-containing protein